MITAQTAYLAASLASGHSPVLAEAFTAAACGLLPDLDKRQGIVGRLFPMISEPLDYHIGHRTLTHSLLFLGLLGLVLWYLLPFGWWLAVVAGTGSHILADMLTPSGVELFWPSKARAVLPGNARYRFEAMGWAELGFAAVMGLAAVPMLQLAQAGEGTGGVIRSAIGKLATARQDYDAQKGANAWSLRVRGRDNRSYEDVAGEYAVIGLWGENGFILRSHEGPRSVCEQQACDWYADHAVLVRGEPEITTTRSLTAERFSVTALIETLKPLQASGEVYLIGNLHARNMREEPPTVSVAGETVSLHYAATGLLEGWQAGVLRDVRLSVQVRHDPDEQVPELVLPEGNAMHVPHELGRWLK